jgi:hypothetical protein
MHPKAMHHIAAITALVLATLSLAGCQIDGDKHGDGKNVKVITPFGGMQVKTNNSDVLAGIGLPTYPGAVAVKKLHPKDKDDDDDNGSADINMSFGSFQLKVKAIDYRTDDSPQKVFDFYKKALGRYGDVIQCSNDRPVGTPTHTNEGLTCEDTGHNDHGDHDHSGSDRHAAKDGDSPFHGSAKVQLKAGSKKHQHIVDINPDNGGAKFGLVSLDLPTDFSFGDKSDKPEQDDKQ